MGLELQSNRTSERGDEFRSTGWLGRRIARHSVSRDWVARIRWQLVHRRGPALTVALEQSQRESGNWNYLHCIVSYLHIASCLTSLHCIVSYLPASLDFWRDDLIPVCGATSSAKLVVRPMATTLSQSVTARTAGVVTAPVWRIYCLFDGRLFVCCSSEWSLSSNLVTLGLRLRRHEAY